MKRVTVLIMSLAMVLVVGGISQISCSYKSFFSSSYCRKKSAKIEVPTRGKWGVFLLS